jgi:hypothetical protein
VRVSVKPEGPFAPLGLIDTAFDFRSDTPGGPRSDPDSKSPTLRRYHKILWSKPLPRGALFTLDDTRRGAYLYHRSDLGEFWLGSDAVMQTFTRWPEMRHITEQLSPAENEEFYALGYTIGGMMVFPGNQIDGRMTINQARGMNKWTIADRMDLTLECVRRFYAGDTSSPLGGTIARYADFFALFDDFRGYTEFFLLQDLVTDDGDAVRFFTEFEDFRASSRPHDLQEYRTFRANSIELIAARNRRIAALGL